MMTTNALKLYRATSKLKQTRLAEKIRATQERIDTLEANLQSERDAMEALENYKFVLDSNEFRTFE